MKRFIENGAAAREMSKTVLGSETLTASAGLAQVFAKADPKLAENVKTLSDKADIRSGKDISPSGKETLSVVESGKYVDQSIGDMKIALQAASFEITAQDGDHSNLSSIAKTILSATQHYDHHDKKAMDDDDFEDTIIGTMVDDFLDRTFKNDCIFGLGGDGIIDGYGGDDINEGSLGNDHITAGLGSDIIFGGQGRR